MSSETIEAARDAVEDQVEDHLNIAMEKQLKIVDDEAKPINGEAKPIKERKQYQKRYYNRYRDTKERLLQLEEEQKSKEVLETGLKGTVKWYSVYSNYGFIAREDGKPDIFVHQTAISKSKMEKIFMRTLEDNEAVEFDVVQGRKGPEAANVTGPDGAEVHGTKRFHYRYTRRQYVKKSEDGARRVPKTKKGEPEDAEKAADKKAGRRRRNFRDRKNKPAGEEAMKDDTLVTDTKEPVAASSPAEKGSGDAAVEASGSQ